MTAQRPTDEIDVIVPNFNRRYSGVTSTVRTLLPVQARYCGLAGVGTHLPPGITTMPRWKLLFLRRRPKNRPFRIFHARRNVEMVWGIVLRDLLRLPLKLVFTSAAQRHHKPFTRWLIARMDALIATSDQAASFLRHPARVIMHGIDIDRFKPPQNKPEAWAALDMPGKRGIGAFGRLRHQKGQDLFVQAMIRLLPKYPDCTAVLLGLTTPSEQAFEQKLKDEITKAGLEDRILILGEKPAEDIPQWFAALSIYVAPMRWEGFGLTPLEAMACQTPPVATRAGAAANLIEDGQNGYLVDVEDLDTMVTRIDKLLADTSHAKALGEAGRHHVEQHFSAEREAREILEVYEALWNTKD